MTGKKRKLSQNLHPLYALFAKLLLGSPTACGKTVAHARVFVSQSMRKGINMHLFLVNKMNELNVDELTFFRIAHVYLFATDPDMSNLVAQYKLHGIIPAHVVSYIKILEGELSCGKSSR